MKRGNRLTTFLNRWRKRRVDPATGETTETVTTETVETGKTPETVTEAAAVKHKNRAPLIAAGIILLTLATLLGLAFAPGARDSSVGRTIRFWEKAPPPEPAVPAGQLAMEVEKARTENPGGTITIDPATAEALGLQTFEVEARAFDQQVRTTGRVTVDERRVTQVHTKVDGYIEETFGNFEGQQIRRGQPLFTIYSPELLASQQEYLIALRARGDFVKSEFEVVKRAGTTLVEASRRRLQLFDVTPEKIRELERTGNPSKTVTFYAPASGVVTERTAFPGMRVTPETQLYTLADLSTIWVEADVYESDLPNISVGTTTELILPNGETATGRIAYINPFVVPESRTARARIEVANPGLRLKPGMFVNVSLRSVQPPQVIVPRDAVLATGTRYLVLVAGENGRFMLREITTKGQNGEFYLVQSGVNVRDRVARNIQFLIDSETQLREAVDSQTGGGANPNKSGNSSGGMQGMPGM